MRIGSLKTNGRRAVIDVVTDEILGEVVSEAGPATLGESHLALLERDTDGVAVGGVVLVGNGRGLALVEAFWLYKIFPRKE